MAVGASNILDIFRPGSQKYSVLKGGLYGLSSPQVRRRQYKAELENEQNLPENIRVGLVGETKTAGTFAPTEQFARGFESEYEARVRGAKQDASGRLGALRRRMGIA